MRNFAATPGSPRHVGTHLATEMSTGRPAAALICGVFLAMLSLAFEPTSAVAETTQPDLQRARELISQDDHGAAAELLIRLDTDSDRDLSLELLHVARNGTGELDAGLVDQLYDRAAKSLTKSEPTAETLEKRALVRSLAAIHFIGRGNQDAARKVLVEALDEATDLVESLSRDRARQLVQLAIRTAWSALNSQQPAHAESIYKKLITLSDRADWKAVIGDDRSVIMLGHGWSIAMQPDRMEDAAEKLGAFVDAFPEHNDAPGAAALRVRCLAKSKDPTEFGAAIGEFLERWPKHSSTHPAVLTALKSPHSDPSGVAGKALLNWIIEGGVPADWSPELVRRAIVYAGPALPPPRFDVLLRRLAARDEKGHQVAVLLQESGEEGNAGLAEQVAATLISGDLTDASQMARESACRWAGRTGRWSMLALAAESTDIEAEDASRSVHVERLFAEALTRAGRGRSAAAWWQRVVDKHGANDFATLLRCAELAVAHSDLSEATQRLDAIQALLNESETATDSVHAALVDLLAADVAIRKVDFREARALLERVIRNPASTAPLRGRAQWMIGETHFMQHQFAEAIDSYRDVEGLDPGGPFAPAALIQAGKSFEQLGLTREAGDCYSALLGRFAESAHAIDARRRMAALPQIPRSNVDPAGKPRPNPMPPQSSRMRR